METPNQFQSLGEANKEIEQLQAFLIQTLKERDEARSERNEAWRVITSKCDHKGIGLPGCTVCDPRYYKTRKEQPE